MDRFWSKVDKVGSCWLWLAACNTQGYGKYAIGNGRWKFAHRYAWGLRHGPVPRGMVLHHTCDVPACVNPEHLQLVPANVHTKAHHAERRKRRTHCVRGHTLTPDNVWVSKTGNHQCRQCWRYYYSIKKGI